MNAPSTGHGPCQVIAIAAPMGGGKSTLVAALCAELKGSVALHFDDYETATQQSLDQLAEWLVEGADFSRIRAPGLAEQLAALRGSGAPYIIFEMPLGRAWPATRNDIDLLVWMDVPLDIALARRMLEITGDQDAARAWMRHYLSHYIATVHDVLVAQCKAVQPHADLTVNGRAEVSVMVDQIMQALAERRGAHDDS